MRNLRIHSVELLEMALQAAANLGYRIREDALGGSRGGICQVKDKKWLFLDPALPPRDRLQLALEALGELPEAELADLAPPLIQAIQVARAA